MVKCHVVDVHMTPLRELQHTYHQNIKRILSSHDYLQHDLSHDCWKYALEAIIKALLLYFLVHDNCLLFML